MAHHGETLWIADKEKFKEKIREIEEYQRFEGDRENPYAIGIQDVKTPKVIEIYKTGSNDGFFIKNKEDNSILSAAALTNEDIENLKTDGTLLTQDDLNRE